VHGERHGLGQVVNHHFQRKIVRAEDAVLGECLASEQTGGADGFAELGGVDDDEMRGSVGSDCARQVFRRGAADKQPEPAAAGVEPAEFACHQQAGSVVAAQVGSDRQHGDPGRLTQA